MKSRVYEIAKEMGLENKAVLEKCKQIGIPVKSHSSSIDLVDAQRLRLALHAMKGTSQTPSAPAKPAAKKPAPSRPPARPAGKRPERSGPSRPAGRPGGEKRPPPRRPAEPTPRRREVDPKVKMHVIEEPGKFGEQVKHVKLEKQGRRGAPQTAGGRTQDRGRRGDRSFGRSAGPGLDTDLKGKTFTIQAPISVKDISNTLGIRANQLIRHLMELGFMATINQMLDSYAIGLIGEKLDITLEVQEKKKLEEEVLAEEPDDPKDLVYRAPVVTMLGHVDHGKTSLLDRIRQTDVAAGESGGITQHIGASRVKNEKGHVVFLDTPGHAAFTEMRSRGANVTDVVVLVVAADDGVMPQTEEAINHARAAGVPIVVAVNKVDKPEANVMRVKQQLAGLDLAAEDWGGKTVYVEVSATTGQGVDQLLEMLQLESELLDLKANPKKPARGTVLEARMTEGKGVLAHLLVQTGTLRRGDIVVCGPAYGRVRGMFDETGRSIQEAGPSTPVEITGLSAVPSAGNKMYVVAELQLARQIAEERKRKVWEAELSARQHVTLESLYSHLADKQVKELNVVLKADVNGSLEVLTKSLNDLSTDEVRVKVLHRAVGAINESDVLLADASDAVVIGFHVVVEERARAAAEERGVEIRTYQVIYQITDELKKALEGMLEPEEKEVSLGRAEIREIFKASKIGTIAGCMVTKGLMRKNAKIRVARDGIVIHDGRMDSLKRFQEDAKDVKEGLECGIKVAGFDDVKQGDLIECYEIQKVARKLESVQKSK